MKSNFKLSETSTELLKRLIRQEFDKVDPELDYIFQNSEMLITLAKEVGFLDLAEEMKNDLN